MNFTATRLSDLPALSWAAEIHADLSVSAICGSAVETDDRGLVAGAWAGDFGERQIATAATSIGTALRLGNGGIIAHCGTAGSAPIFFCRHGRRVVVANTPAFALAAAGDRLDATNPYYVNDACTFLYGSDRYRSSVATTLGRLSTYYGSMLIGPNRELTRAPFAEPPNFGNYASYRAYLGDQTALIFANACDPSRRQRYVPIASVSSGYDSSAAAVIAHEAGCREGFTFGEPNDRPDSAEDSGFEIGTMMGLAMSEYRTFGYKARTDLPEVEFVASNFAAGQVFLSGAESALAGRLMVSGIGGDWVWAEKRGWRKSQAFPFFVGGYSEIEFLARAPALSLAVPMIGGCRLSDLDEISQSPAMRAWSIGGDYDRPIPRRILEDAGVPRGSFAGRKRRVAVEYFGLNRRQPELDRYFSKHSVAEFEAWFAREQPMTQAHVVRHRLIADTIGRLVWSGRTTRTLSRFGLHWPPFGHRILRYKVPISKNFYAFNWAVGLQTNRYRRALGEGA